MAELSIIVPGRKEEWLARTVADVLAHAEADTEVVAVIDGETAGEPCAPHPRLRVEVLPESIGQRAATNHGMRLSSADYVMKLDAHCAVAPGFDRVLLDAIRGRDTWTLIPQQRNLWVFSWKCKTCGERNYMGPMPERCTPVNYDGRAVSDRVCSGTTFERMMEWRPRPGTRTDFWQFDSTLHFQYRGNWRGRRVEAGDLAETLSCLGACWLMRRDRYWELGGLDEAHGSWGQMGTEIACKTWLSGGRLLTHRGTWYAHMFRTRQSEGFGFPYHNPGSGRLRAQDYSRDLWMNDKWPGQVYPLAWLINKFKPLRGQKHVDEQGKESGYTGWHDEEPDARAALKHIRDSERRFYRTHENMSRRVLA